MGDWTSDAIGSCSNDSDDASEMNRAHIFEFNPDGTDQKVYAWGLRNAVGIAFCPGTASSRIQRRYLCRIPRRWNRTGRTGYKIVRVPFDHSTGKVLGEYEDFVTGFGMRDGLIRSRPVGIPVAKDGAVLFSEDGNGAIWRVSYGE
jgi:glucose/arabinose dehydrogenase